MGFLWSTFPVDLADIPTDSDIEVGDQDTAFDLQEKDLHAKRNSYEVDYKVYSPMDIQNYQNKQIAEVAMITNQPPEATAILLRHARWNKEKLINSYMENQDQVLEEAGLGRSIDSRPQIKTVKNFTCEICYDDSRDLQTFAMKCGHRFCVNCYTHYLAQKIKEEGEAARIKCPGDGCNRIVDSKSLDLLVTEDLKDRYIRSDVYLRTG